jgi:hypothetical protein
VTADHRKTMGGHIMAAVPYEFDCNMSDGFVMDPNEHVRIGWMTALDGFGLPAGGLKADLQVYNPMTITGGQPGIMSVVGVLQKFTWTGGVGDPLKLDFYVSQENAFQIKALEQVALKNLVVKAVNLNIIDYDQEVKTWFTALAPEQLSGTITNQGNPELDVDLNPVAVKDGIDVNVYKVHISISPAVNKVYPLKFANSSARTVVKSWGLVVGNLSA